MHEWKRYSTDDDFLDSRFRPLVFFFLNLKKKEEKMNKTVSQRMNLR